MIDVLRQEWCNALNVPEVKDEDDFFALGGDSLLAIELVERLEQQIPVSFPIEELFLEGTFGALRRAYAESSGRASDWL